MMPAALYCSAYIQFESITTGMEYDPEKTDHKPRFHTYNGTEEHRQSLNATWGPCMNYPSYNPDSIFAKARENQQPHDQVGVPSARQAWSKFMPPSTSDANSQKPKPSIFTADANDFKRPISYVNIPKPTPFMGAFSHLQDNHTSTPNVQPWGRPNSFFQQPFPLPSALQNPYQQNFIGVGSITALHDIQTPSKPQTQRKDFFELESERADDFSVIQMEQSRVSKVSAGEEKSILWNYEELFEQEDEFVKKDPAWQQQEHQETLKVSRVFEVHKDQSLLELCRMEGELSTVQETQMMLPDEFVVRQITRMLQGVECELFRQDYYTGEWSLDLTKYCLQYTLRSSLDDRLRGVLNMAKHRYRLDIALKYIETKPFRRIYFEIGLLVRQFLIVFEEILLLHSNSCTLLQFLLQLDKVKPQIDLLYNILINEECMGEQERSWLDFDYRCLNSEYIVYKQVLKMTRFSDSAVLQTKPILVKLVTAVLKPVLSILKEILFEACSVVQLNSEVYLKHYFQNYKDILTLISKKMELIKHENHQLYKACTMHQGLAVHHDVKSLKEYERGWRHCFERKRKIIEKVRRSFKKRIALQKERRQEEKIRSILEIKSKFAQQQEEERLRKAAQKARNKQERQRLQKQIRQRAQKRKLLKELQKEKERGLILDEQLKQKMRVAKEKERLQKIIQDEIGSQMVQEHHEEEKKVLPDENQKPDLPSNSVIKQSGENEKQVKEAKGHEQENEEKIVRSEQKIVSKETIEYGNVFTSTGDYFRRAKGRVSIQSEGKTQSYFKIKPKQSLAEDLDSNSESSDSVSSIESEDEAGDSGMEIDVETALQICVDDVIRQQMDLVDSTLRFLIIEQYQTMSIIEFLGGALFGGQGQRLLQFMNLAVNDHSRVQLKHFSECLLFDTELEHINKLAPTFYNTGSKLDNQINIFEDSLEDYIGFQFKNLPSLLEPYFSYNHMSRYIQIFRFVLRLKHAAGLTSRSWLMLSDYRKELWRRQRKGYEVQAQNRIASLLDSARHAISSFFSVFESYFFLRVVTKQLRVMRSVMGDLHELENHHLKMLEGIVRAGFVSGGAQGFADRLASLFRYVQDYFQIVKHLTLDDLPAFKWEETERKVKFLRETFRAEHKNVEQLIRRMS